MKPKWNDYSKWECYQNGMYKEKKRGNVVNKCINILTSENVYDRMLETVISWNISSETNLSQKVVNRKPWIGQVVCCYFCKATVNETSIAWGLLDKEQKIKANLAAQRIIDWWENENL